jgi:hypothetical protein
MAMHMHSMVGGRLVSRGDTEEKFGVEKPPSPSQLLAGPTTHTPKEEISELTPYTASPRLLLLWVDIDYEVSTTARHFKGGSHRLW